MKPEQYWKLRSMIIQAQMLEMQAKNILVQIDFIKNNAFKEAGLDPTKNYKMNDETLTVEEVTNDSK